MKKLAVYALILSLLATAFCSCASKTGGTASTDTTAQAVETEADTRIYPDLPANDFDGYTFRLAHWEVSGWNWIECDWISTRTRRRHRIRLFTATATSR